jgi:phosphoribosylformimino-5-aminoimidazole carboxamide ribonucleotide (ProFAR) isomerase
MLNSSAEVIKGVDLRVELSGGIRDDDSLRRALATGCERVNLGTAALENPDWTAKVISEFGDRIAVGLDVRGHTLAARGWTREGGDLFETIERLDRDGCSRYIVTDVAKDGTLTGPNLDLLRESLCRYIATCCSKRWGIYTCRSCCNQISDVYWSRRCHCRQSVVCGRIHAPRSD